MNEESRKGHVRNRRPVLRKYLELTQDVILFGLCLVLFVGMEIKLFHLGQLMMRGIDFSQALGEVLFMLVLVELIRLPLIYLEKHYISVSTMVEAGIVSAVREVILRRGFANRTAAVAGDMRPDHNARHSTALFRRQIAPRIHNRLLVEKRRAPLRVDI
jgi:uncharacterized membrane protein (DUF373 family)